MKFIEPRPFADPEVAARKLIELANAFEPVQDGRIYIECCPNSPPRVFKRNGPSPLGRRGLGPSGVYRQGGRRQAKT
jgi:hypothetical protein